MLAVAGPVAVYVWKPAWPHSVARLPLWPYLPFFLVTIGLISLYLRSRLNPRSIILGATMIATYFYLELLVSAFSFAAWSGRLSGLSMSDVAAYFIIPSLNVLANLAVIAAFVSMETAITMFDRWTMHTPAKA